MDDTRLETGKIVGCNGYSGKRFPLVFGDPLKNQEPFDTLRDFHSMTYAPGFDDNDNLYITDFNRARVLIYKKPFEDEEKDK